MINTIEEFKIKYPKAAIVNYDMENTFDCGLCYKTGPGIVERLRKDKGKYITYPKIQPYSELNTDYKIFIIRNNKMYELEQGNEKHTFHIKREITNVDISIFDDIYLSKAKHKNPTIVNEDIYIIYE